MKILKPLIDEFKTRKIENEKLKDSIRQEFERIKSERESKSKSRLRKIGFVNNIADKISDSNDEKELKRFEEKKKKELEFIRKQRESNYIGSIFALLGMFILLLAIIITIGAICEKNTATKSENNAATENIATPDKEKKNDEASGSLDEDTISEENQTINEIENNSQEQQNIEHTPPASTPTNEKPTNTLEEAPTVQESNNEAGTYHNERMVWIPTNGGNKYHSRPGCSKMKNPKEVSLEQAEKNGYTPCKRCN